MTFKRHSRNFSLSQTLCQLLYTLCATNRIRGRTLNASSHGLHAWSEIEVQRLPFSVETLYPPVSGARAEAHGIVNGKDLTDALNMALMAGDRHAYIGDTLEQVVIRSWAHRSTDREIFDAAAQAWNHRFLWQSLVSGRALAPSGKLASAIDAAFGSHARFLHAWRHAALSDHAHGWLWLTHDRDCDLKILRTKGNETPLGYYGDFSNPDTQLEHTPILNMDIQERTDSFNDEQLSEYVDSITEDLLSWKVVEQRYENHCANLKDFLADVSMYHLYL